MEIFGNNGNNLEPKSAEIKIIKYKCDKCDYNTSQKSHYNKHLISNKHKWKCQETISALSAPKSAERLKYSCIMCNKVFKTNSGLWKHKKICKKLQENDNKILEKLNNNEEINYNEIITTMMVENKKLLETISELIPKVGSNNNTVNNTINKQKFNINIFLNEQCKDALTITEFIDRIKITLDDLMVTKNKGLSEGVSNIFIENMNKLSIHERPMHCTDVKRETVYIKCDGNTENGNNNSYWKKDENNKRLKQALNNVTHVQRKNIDKWIDNHPNWVNVSHEQDEYLLLVKTCTDDLQENKVIKKVCNNVHIGEETQIRGNPH